MVTHRPDKGSGRIWGGKRGKMALRNTLTRWNPIKSIALHIPSPQKEKGKTRTRRMTKERENEENKIDKK